MKVTYCITRSDTIGGAHVHVADMAAWMRSQGHEAGVIVGGEGPYCDHLEKLGVPYRISRHLQRAIAIGQDLAAVRELRRLFRAEAPDLLSLHSAKAGILGRVAAVGLGVPVVFTAHGWSFTQGVSGRRAQVYWLLEKGTARLCRLMIAVSAHDRSKALAVGLCPPERIVTIQNAMPDSELRADPGRPVQPVRIVSIARLQAPKDHSTLLESLARLPAGTWEADLVGDGPLEGEVRAQLTALGLTERVRLLGLRDDVPELLAAGQLFVLVSRSEGFPRSILEAMRAGLPVLASAVGGVPEAVEEGVTGHLLRPGDSAQLAGHLQALIDDPSARQRLGQAGRLRYEESFRFERMAAATLAAYRKCLEPAA